MRAFSSTSLVAAGALGLVALSWGAIPLFVRNDVPSTALVGARVTFGVLALIGVAAIAGRLSFPTVARGRLALCGVLLAMHWVTFFESIKFSPVAVALAVLYLGPIAAALLAGPVLGEQGARRLWLALVIAALGTVLVIQPWSGGDSATTGRGLLMAALSAVFLTSLLLVGKPVAAAVGGLTMAMGELAVAAVLLAPATYQAFVGHAEHWPAFLVLGALLTGVASLIYWEAMRHLPLVTVSVITYLEPASAVVWAAALLGEVPNALAWVGVALVLTAGVTAASAAAAEEVIGAPAAL